MEAKGSTTKQVAQDNHGKMSRVQLHVSTQSYGGHFHCPSWLGGKPRCPLKEPALACHSRDLLLTVLIAWVRQDGHFRPARQWHPLLNPCQIPAGASNAATPAVAIPQHSAVLAWSVQDYDTSPINTETGASTRHRGASNKGVFSRGATVTHGAGEGKLTVLSGTHRP